MQNALIYRVKTWCCDSSQSRKEEMVVMPSIPFGPPLAYRSNRLDEYKSLYNRHVSSTRKKSTVWEQLGRRTYFSSKRKKGKLIISAV